MKRVSQEKRMEKGEPFLLKGPFKIYRFLTLYMLENPIFINKVLVKYGGTDINNQHIIISKKIHLLVKKYEKILQNALSSYNIIGKINTICYNDIGIILSSDNVNNNQKQIQHLSFNIKGVCINNNNQINIYIENIQTD